MVQLFKKIAHHMPNLALKLKQGGMEMTTEEFVKRTFLSAFYVTTGLLLIATGFLSQLDVFVELLLILAPALFVIMFTYFLFLPDVRARRIMVEINSEVVDAGRFLIVELESGVPLYDSLRGVSRNFSHIGKYFSKIVISIDSGTGIDEAVTEVLEYTPSQDFRRILWQILNSLKTGSDVARGLKEVIEQISREHLIEIRRYGRKLNPLSMFYMIIAVIVPSLGIAMLVVFSSLLSIQIDFPVLMVIALILGFVQFMFLAVVRSSRPAVNM